MANVAGMFRMIVHNDLVISLKQGSSLLTTRWMYVINVYNFFPGNEIIIIIHIWWKGHFYYFVFHPGPPVEIDKIITMDTTVTLSVKFLSVKRPYNPRWFYKKMRIPNSTQFFQNMSKDILVIRMYGKVLTHNGYIANLTISNDYAIFKCYLLIDNEYGTTKMEFEFNNHYNGIIFTFPTY